MQLLESSAFNIIITSLTIFALFGDDIRVIAFNQNADIAFDIISLICLSGYQFAI
jgi:hypothetical protein